MGRELETLKVRADFLRVASAGRRSAAPGLVVQAAPHPRQPSGATVEYHVSHVPWKVWNATHAGFSGDTRDLYGDELSELLTKAPVSAFIAHGSPVKVFRGSKLPSAH